MMVIHAVILGAVQGVTEFLPVSSSGHLVLLQKFFGITESSLFFDIMVHIGTLGAVIIVFWKDVRALLVKPFQKRALLLIVGTVPAAIVGLFFDDAIKRAFQSGFLLGPAFLFTALVLTVAERLSEHPRTSAVKRKMEEMSVPDALLIGLCQGIAVLPAVSRSGMTLAGGLLRGISREDAARFSFLLSIPVILGAFVLQIVGLRTEKPEIAILPVAAGMITAFITGYLAIKLMLKIVREKRLRGFALYTAILGILCVIIR
jgi:undecaprenyl-diphosphatase